LLLAAVRAFIATWNIFSFVPLAPLKAAANFLNQPSPFGNESPNGRRCPVAGLVGVAQPNLCIKYYLSISQIGKSLAKYVQKIKK
jgi:hypothetical protein